MSISYLAWRNANANAHDPELLQLQCKRRAEIPRREATPAGSSSATRRRLTARRQRF